MKHILVIEDQPDLVSILTRLLRAASYQVSAARDGVEGFALALQLHPDLILLDLAMPRMDGWQVLELLRGHPTMRTIPVLITTATPLSYAQRRIGEFVPINPLGCIQKPWRSDELLCAIKDLLTKATLSSVVDTNRPSNT